MTVAAYGIVIAAILVGSFFAISTVQQAIASGNAPNHNATSSAARGNATSHNATTAGNKTSGGVAARDLNN
jgi:hypothetical protein